MKIKYRPLVIAAFGTAIIAAPVSADTRLQLSAGANYAAGDFGGSSNTDVLVLPFSARFAWDAWSVRASFPYIRENGPADVAVILDDQGGGSNSGPGGSGSGSGSGSSGNGSSNGGSGNSSTSGGNGGSGSGNSGGDDAVNRFSKGRSVSGIGDSSLSLTRSFNDIASSPVYIDVTGRVKFATGSEKKGLGVGATDYAALSEFGWDAGIGGVFANGGRRFVGHSSSLQRVDGWQWSAGGWLALNNVVELGANYSWSDASVQGGANPKSVEADLALHLGGRFKLAAFASRGLSDGSPDYSGGLTLIWTALSHRTDSHRS